MQVNIACSLFSSLVDEDECMGSNQMLLGRKLVKARELGLLKIATWNFAGLCSERKQKEISEVLNRVKVHIVAGQKMWEKKDKVVNVDAYKWFGNPCIDRNDLRRGRGWLFSLRVHCGGS